MIRKVQCTDQTFANSNKKTVVQLSSFYFGNVDLCMFFSSYTMMVHSKIHNILLFLEFRSAKFCEKMNANNLFVDFYYLIVHQRQDGLLSVCGMTNSGKLRLSFTMNTECLFSHLTTFVCVPDFRAIIICLYYKCLYFKHNITIGGWTQRSSSVFMHQNQNILGK